MNIIRTLIPAALLAASPYGLAAEESVPASSNVGTADYPRIASDLRVTSG
jgi:hypothetical protein